MFIVVIIDDSAENTQEIKSIAEKSLDFTCYCIKSFNSVTDFCTATNFDKISDINLFILDVEMPDQNWSCIH